MAVTPPPQILGNLWSVSLSDWCDTRCGWCLGVFGRHSGRKVDVKRRGIGMRSAMEHVSYASKKVHAGYWFDCDGGADEVLVLIPSTASMKSNVGLGSEVAGICSIALLLPSDSSITTGNVGDGCTFQEALRVDMADDAQILIGGTNGWLVWYCRNVHLGKVSDDSIIDNIAFGHLRVIA
ncbi:hypothetical protein BDQ17DRAFT_1411449 [Cyathus striatus]|nr:hypothetical protein BDQ17DRAFT_1411449 [Cyathus striatus]